MKSDGDGDGWKGANVTRACVFLCEIIALSAGFEFQCRRGGSRKHCTHYTHTHTYAKCQCECVYLPTSQPPKLGIISSVLRDLACANKCCASADKRDCESLNL